MKIPIEISARHIHLCRKDIDILFGKNYQLQILKEISQTGQFATQETLTLINKENKIENVRIIGPERNESQVEISITDCYKLKVTPIIRISGDIKGTPGITIQGPKGKVQLKQGVIVSKRHLHISEEQNKKFNFKNNQTISIKVKGERGLIFDNVVVRLGQGNNLSFQIDTDEANSAGIIGKGEGEIFRLD